MANVIVAEERDGKLFGAVWSGGTIDFHMKTISTISKCPNLFAMQIDSSKVKINISNISELHNVVVDLMVVMVIVKFENEWVVLDNEVGVPDDRLYPSCEIKNKFIETLNRC